MMACPWSLWLMHGTRMLDLADHPFRPRMSGRYPRSCVTCGRNPETHPITHTPRDTRSEREITLLAAQAHGIPEPAARHLDQYADQRAHPGGIRASLNALQEACEELADARNYLTWGIQRLEARVQAGEHDALNERTRLLRCLGHVQQAWTVLHTH